VFAVVLAVRATTVPAGRLEDEGSAIREAIAAVFVGALELAAVPLDYGFEVAHRCQALPLKSAPFVASTA